MSHKDRDGVGLRGREREKEQEQRVGEAGPEREERKRERKHGSRGKLKHRYGKKERKKNVGTERAGMEADDEFSSC